MEENVKWKKEREAKIDFEVRWERGEEVYCKEKGH